MILFYDTETTGLPAKGKPLDHILQPRIVQLGVICDFEDGREAMRLDVILRHDVLPDEVEASWVKAAAIHGISRELSDKVGVAESDALNMLQDLIEVADVVVGQNILGFDNGIVTGSVRRAFKDPSLEPFKDKKTFDTMRAGAALMKRSTGKVNLTTLHKHLFGEEFADAHQAISDVLACRRCFYRLREIAQGVA